MGLPDSWLRARGTLSVVGRFQNGWHRRGRVCESLAALLRGHERGPMQRGEWSRRAQVTRSVPPLAHQFADSSIGHLFRKARKKRYPVILTHSQFAADFHRIEQLQAARPEKLPARPAAT